jgi:cell division septum initiation protein DivIVA
MTATKLAVEIVEENENLTKENERLQSELSQLQDEHMLVVKTVVKTLKSVELWPLKENDNIASKAIKGVKTVITQSMLNPKALEERFSFVREIISLAEKYKDINV